MAEAGTENIELDHEEEHERLGAAAEMNTEDRVVPAQEHQNGHKNLHLS